MRKYINNRTPGRRLSHLKQQKRSAENIQLI